MKNSKSVKFGREMLKNAENIAMQNLLILYTFLLRAEIRTTFTPKVVQIFLFFSLFSCSGGFCFSCFNKNLAKHWNCPFIRCPSLLSPTEET